MKVIKRRDHKEGFKESKLVKSCYKACLNAHLSEKEANLIAKKVLSEVKKKLKGKKEIKAEVLNKYVLVALRKYNKDAAFLFETHHDVC